ncbi:DMT family transporter [Spirulina sp. 06S082]|uniref:DMT family transporter n=1 Tax=Spirulina sp. 06S082 TaxID=3110248 RepID=UPI002B1FA00D|nr:DMT family transporter [Spirulina sp. 06S082]MEA5469997.1 DMT family transporter [Spirulina sp. 06S082]
MTEGLQSWQQRLWGTPVAIAIASLFFALVIQAFNPILIKLSESEVSPNATVFNRFWISLVVVGLWNVLQIGRSRQSDRQAPTASLYSPKILWLLLAMGITGGTSMVLWAWSLTQTPVANSAIAFSLTPLFTTVLEWLIWRKRFELKFGIGMAIALFGTFTLGMQDLSYNTLYLQGDSIALLGAVLFAVYLMLVEQLRTQLTATTIFLWRYAISIILVIPPLLVSSDLIFPSSWVGWLFVILLAAGSAAQILIVYSLKQLSSSLVALVLLLDPVLTAILARIIFSEQLGWLNWLAFTVILLGVYLAISSKLMDRSTEFVA